MITKRIHFSGGKNIDYYGSEHGVWSEKVDFIPLRSIRMMLFQKKEQGIHWIAYSEKYDWAYINKTEDDFIRYLLEVLRNTETYEVVQGNQDDCMFYLKDNLFLHYSSRQDLLIEFVNKAHTTGKIQHKVWFYDFRLNSEMTAHSSDDHELTKEECEALNDFGNTVFVKGFFHPNKQSSKNHLTELLTPETELSVFEHMDEKHFFSSNKYDQKVLLSQVVHYQFSGPEQTLNIAILSSSNVWIFNEGKALIQLLEEAGSKAIKMEIGEFTFSEPTPGNQLLTSKSAKGDKLSLIVSKDQHWFHAKMNLSGQEEMLFHLGDLAEVPDLQKVSKQKVNMLWKGKADSTSAPNYVKEYKRFCSTRRKKDIRSAISGCTLILLIAGVVLYILNWWFF
jgi:hypothetical protein